MKKIALITALATLGLLLAPRSSDADEGMFLLYEAHKLNLKALKKRGLALDVKQLQGLAPAIAQLARGGTGSFVSANGLVVTNHHVAYRCLAVLDATDHKGIMNRGHVATSRATEIPCPGYDMLAVIEVKDVTQQVLSVVKPRMKPAKRAKAIRVQKRTLEAACEKGGGRICEVRALNGGAGFVQSTYKRIRDVRLVYAPPKDLGKYGGDIDNWRYPRHTADFTFLRAYVSPIGEGTDYAETNVPFKPKRFLKVSTSGVRRGQLNLVLGFPGRTLRHATYARAKYHSDFQLARKVAMFRSLIEALPDKGAAARRYQGLESGLNNAMKYYSDSIKQFRNFKLLDRKKAWMAKLAKRIDASPALKKKHGDLLKRIDAIYAKLGPLTDQMLLLSYAPHLVKSLSTAVDIVRWSSQRLIPDIEREGERYRDKNVYRVTRASKMLEQLTALEGEKALLLRFLKLAKKLPKRQQLSAVKWLERYGNKQLKKLRRAANKKKKTLVEIYTAQLGVPWAKQSPLEVGLDAVYAHTKLYAGDADKDAGRSRALWARTRLLDPSALGDCAPTHGKAGAAGGWCTGSKAKAKDKLQKLARKVKRAQAKVAALHARAVKLKTTRKQRKKLQRKIDRATRQVKRARRKLAKAIARAVKRDRDPLLQLAKKFVRDSDKLDKGPLAPLEKVLAPILRPQLVKEVIRPKYWDANFTLRLSYGTVKDYTESKTKKRWRYLSRLTWLIKKGKGKYPFRVPARLRTVYKKKDFGRWVDPVVKDVPVNFTNTLDTTGGNSGSPVLNGKGELIGLLFDGTPESILSDWQYLEKDQRSICLDIRFALFLADKVDKAKYVLAELGLKNADRPR